jgi:hypothetical protein
MTKSSASMKGKKNCHLRNGTLHVVVLTGLGGVGKTRLAISFAIQRWMQYSAVFQLNAKCENTLNQGFAAMIASIPRLKLRFTLHGPR